MNESIEIIHETYTSYFNRIKDHILIGFFVTLLFVLFSLFKNENLWILLTTLFGLAVWFISIKKILKEKLYLIDFYSNSKTVNLKYFYRNAELDLEIPIDDVDVSLNNESSKTNKKYSLNLKANSMCFRISNDYDWHYHEMERIFTYIRKIKNISITEKEDYILSQMRKTHF